MILVITIPLWWITQTAKLESNFNPNAKGDNGASRGMYQIQERTWYHYSDKTWEVYAHDPEESKRVCRLILMDCAKKCQRDKKPVTFKNARYYYRHGGF